MKKSAAGSSAEESQGEGEGEGSEGGEKGQTSGKSRVENCGYMGFSPDEFTELPGHFDAPYLLQKVSASMQFSVYAAPLYNIIFD